MSEEKEIEQSINRGQIVGVVAELNLEVIEKEVELKGANGNKKKVTCKQVAKKDFKNPSVLVEVKPRDEDGNERYTATIGVNFFPTNEKKLDENGKIIDNPRFKALLDIMDYTPMSKDKENATRVKVDGNIIENGYATSKDGGNTYEYVSFPIINAFQMSSTSVPDEDSCDFELTGVIRTIKPEMITKNDNTEETGRLLVEFYSFDRNGATYPIPLVVDTDLADDFKDNYEQGTSCKLFVEVLERQVGGNKVHVKKAFGSREAKITSGFSVTEFSVFSGDEPFEEENEYFVPMKLMKEAMTERQNVIDTTIADKKKKDKEGNSGTKKGLGNRKPKVEETEFEDADDDDCPF